MPRDADAYETAKWRTLWLMVGFALLIGVGIITVLRPELEDEAQESTAASATGIDAQEELPDDDALQE